jgi:hypothetical protein
MDNSGVEYAETAYGRVVLSRLVEARLNYDLQALARCISEYDEVVEYLGAEYGTRDALARLLCVAATVLCGSGEMVPPEDNDLRTLLAELRTDLNDAVKFFQVCLALVEPLEQLPA